MHKFLVIFIACTSLSFSKTVNINIQGFAFSPSSTTIDSGDAIKWTNLDASSHTSTSTSGSDTWNSGFLTQNGTFSHTFNKTGTSNYKCSIHPSMTASVTVSPSVNINNKIQQNTEFDLLDFTVFSQKGFVQFKFNLPQTTKITFSIFNVIGENVFNKTGVFSEGINYYSWNGIKLPGHQAHAVHALPAGIFVAKISDGNQTKAIKFRIN